MADAGGRVWSEEAEGALVIRARGKLDQSQGEELVRMADLAEGAIVVSLGEVVYLTSSGIAALVRVAMKGDLRLAAAPACVRDVLELAGVHTLFRFYADEKAAIAGGPA
jgi:anti-anti-sigma factor